MKNIEHQEQVALIKWAGYQHLPNSNLKIGDFLVAIPNGGSRNVITGAMLKAEGVRAGFPDLFLCVPTPYNHGLFIEMKAPTKGARLSEAQKDWITKLRFHGYKSIVCYGFLEAKQAIEEYLQEYTGSPC